MASFNDDSRSTIVKIIPTRRLRRMPDLRHGQTNNEVHRLVLTLFEYVLGGWCPGSAAISILHLATGGACGPARLHAVARIAMPPCPRSSHYAGHAPLLPHELGARSVNGPRGSSSSSLRPLDSGPCKLRSRSSPLCESRRASLSFAESGSSSSTISCALTWRDLWGIH